MSLETIELLALLIGATIAIVGFLVTDLGQAQERAVEAAVDREWASAFFDPTAPVFRPPTEAGPLAAQASAMAPGGPYRYREIPAPTPHAPVPTWLARALSRADACHTLDGDDRVILFLRVAEPSGFLSAPLQWSCGPTPDGRGAMLRLTFTLAGDTHDLLLLFRFDTARHLRHAVYLARQDTVRLDFLTVTDGSLEHGGCRMVALPRAIRGELRRALWEFGREEGEDV